MGIMNAFRNKFKKKDEEPLREYPLGARLGSTVELDVSHLIIAEGLIFSSDLPTEYSVTSLGSFTIQGVKIHDIGIYNNEMDIELIVRFMSDNEIIVYEQQMQENPATEADWKEWVEEDLGKFNQDVMEVEGEEFESDLTLEDDFVIEYEYLENDERSTTTVTVNRLKQFSREVSEVGHEYTLMTIEDEATVNIYAGVDFNSNAIKVN